MPARNQEGVAVRHSGEMRLRNIPTAGGGITRAAYEAAAQAHVPLRALLKDANLTLQQAKNPTLRIAVKDQIKFLNLVADALHDEFLGIHLAQTVDLRGLGLLYYVMASSGTVGDALRWGARCSTILNEGVRIGYRAGKFVSVTFDYLGVARQTDRHQIEFFVTILLRMCRTLSGLSPVPLRIEFMHHRSHLPSEFKALFGPDVEFACGADEVVYPGSIAQTPAINADPYLNALLVKYCEEAMARRRKKSTTWQLKVENAIVPLLPHGHARIGKIAKELGVSRRTLARRLASEGLTFRKLMDRLRFDLARRYLQEKDLPISEIAWLLGYRETSALSHAFKRWTGRTPKREYRANSLDRGRQARPENRL
jgi:AraC-like DNA-binding protein